jgi:NAD(P)-dependent dehydrogenase (short-subunit alcohol dehydrogenase family)
MNRFKNRVVLVTGGSSGIGLATAQAFLEEGAKVAVTGRDGARLDQAVRQLRPHGRVLGIRGDVSKAEDSRRFIVRTERTLGPLEVLVNNAGVYLQKSTEHLTEREWDSVLDINLKGTFLCTKYALPGMIRRKRGTIINVASDSGLVATPLSSAYCASKAGMVLFTRVLAIDHAKDGIRANAICPGEVETPMLDRDAEASGLGYEEYYRRLVAPIPQKRAAKPEEIARAILFMASDEVPFMTGAAVSVDGGWTAL